MPLPLSLRRSDIPVDEDPFSVPPTPVVARPRRTRRSKSKHRKTARSMPRTVSIDSFHSLDASLLPSSPTYPNRFSEVDTRSLIDGALIDVDAMTLRSLSLKNTANSSRHQTLAFLRRTRSQSKAPSVRSSIYHPDLQSYRLSQLSLFHLDGSEPPLPKQAPPPPNVQLVRLEQPRKVLLKKIEKGGELPEAPERQPKSMGPRPSRGSATSSILDPDFARLSHVPYSDLDVRMSDMEKGQLIGPMHRFGARSNPRAWMNTYKQTQRGKLWLAFDVTIATAICGLIILAVLLGRAH